MILLLAGTQEARQLAGALAGRSLPVLASLAGATDRPAPLPVPTQADGFGGAAGFVAVLETHGIRAVIDATHPFAARITARTHAICAERALPLLRLERPAWVPGPADCWTWADDEAEAGRLIPPEATVFLATGGNSLDRWSGLRARSVHLRRIDPPPGPAPFRGETIVARPPFTPAAEADLFRRLGITHLVAKDSGGAGGRAKLDAARDLGIEVVLLRRPPRPEGLGVVATVDEAVAWAEQVALSFLVP